MSFANAIRIMLVLGWLALFGSHALHYALPDLGLRERHDFAAMINANLERSFTYLLVGEQAGSASHALGSCTLAFERDDHRILLTTELRLTDHSFDKLVDTLLPSPGNERSDQRLTLSLSETLDERLQLVAVHARANAHGRIISADGRVGADGLSGTISIDGAATAPFALPEIGAETTQGLAIAISLPPGLRPGESFTSRLVNPDLLSLSAHRAVAVYHARARERTRTLHGELDLLRVDLEVDGRPFSSLWCDDHGTVYVSRQHGAQLALMLERINDLADPATPLWPAPP
jgi:hypothetical protein